MTPDYDAALADLDARLPQLDESERVPMVYGPTAEELSPEWRSARRVLRDAGVDLPH